MKSISFQIQLLNKIAFRIIVIFGTIFAYLVSSKSNAHASGCTKGMTDCGTGGPQATTATELSAQDISDIAILILICLVLVAVLFGVFVYIFSDQKKRKMRAKK